ncbi:O-antigen/teichoic acid export membrane protein [Ulvibacter sp. MAR_2010_11]|uniref:oligosaccharide flippase family protein n=1 Tax=Ulvibacter sp. MAR_2010_11 TaxID=1250229 RepID=UPI000CB6959C|nr:oligosaccharide flippase family protein [Ulvibacter sp. MAR_2010_11]PKA84362.1 O-antigen/teichoic acid export membrane protein [Ulvibacter sp. MAR_2010_11]
MKFLFNFFNSQQIRNAAVGSLGIKFFSAFFAFVNSILLARILGVEAFGIYVLAFSILILASVLVSLGLPKLMTRFIPKYEVEQNLGAVKGLLIQALKYVLLASGILGVVAFLIYLIGWNSIDNVLGKTLYFGLLLIPILAMTSISAASLRGLRFILLGQFHDTFLRNLLFCIGILVFYYGGMKLSPISAILLYTIAGVISFLVGLVFLHRKLFQKIKTVKAEYYNNLWLKEATPFTIDSGIQELKSKVITYILAVFGSIEAVALFDVASRGAALVAFTLDGLNTAIAPYISKAFESKNMESLQRIVTKTSRIIFVFALPVVIVFVIGGKALLNFLYGNVYEDSYVPLVILCIGQLVNAATGSVGLVLNMTGYQSTYTKVNFVITMANAVLSIPFVIYLDVLGASIIFSSLLVIQNLVLVLFLNKRLNINSTIFTFR